MAFALGKGQARSAQADAVSLLGSPRAMARSAVLE